MNEKTPMTVICRVLHQDFTWEVICIDVVVEKSEYLTQTEAYAHGAAARRIREEKILDANDIFQMCYVYNTGVAEDEEFFEPYKGNENPHSKLLKHYKREQS